MQVSSVTLQYMVDDLLLVAIDSRHHHSHHNIVLEGCFEINVEQIPTLAGVIWQLIRNPGLVEAGESVCW